MALHSLSRAMAIITLLSLQGCAELPSLDHRHASTALQDTATTSLGRTLAPMQQAHAGQSGVFAIADGHDAFAARVLLADAAERSLDAQYFIWKKDISGTLLLEAMQRAADRGVRVRLLLDDGNTQGLEATIAELDAHPNIEVRLFNPFIGLRLHAAGYVLDFGRLNRRMHNKSFTVDNQATIVGGRNIGDEYFDAGHRIPFLDLDVLAVGPVVNDVSQEFDRYWASGSSYPAHLVLPAVRTASANRLRRVAVLIEQDPASRVYTEAIARAPFVREMLAHRLSFDWAEVRLLSDDPEKGLGLTTDDELLWPQLKRILKTPKRELLVVSPYFVPGKEGADFFITLAKSGVKVTVFTNSLAATDVPAVHAGYARQRKRLLAAGVGLFELQRKAPAPDDEGLQPSIGSSGSTLHAKTFCIDGERVFVGSFNFDPRSARLNTEMGLVIDSPALALSITDSLRRDIADHAYEVRLTKTGALRWIDRAGGKDLVYEQEPGTSLWQRLKVDLLSILPIEWLL